MIDLKPLMTVKELQTLTRLSRAKIYALATAGVLPCVKLPGCNSIRFAPDDVRAYLQRGRIPAAS